MQSTSSILAPSHAHDLPASPVAHYQQSIIHIKETARLVAAFAQISKPLAVAEVMAHNGMPRLQALLEIWPIVFEACDRWKQGKPHSNGETHSQPIGTSRPQLMCAVLQDMDAQCLLFGLAFRLSCVVQRVPSPIALEPRSAGQTFTGINLLRYSVNLLQMYNAISEIDVVRLPSYLHFQVVVSVSVQLRAYAHMRRTGGDWFKDQEHIVDATVRRIREEVGGAAAQMLEMADEQYGQNGSAHDIDFEAIFGGLPDGWLQAFSLSNDWMAPAGTL